ASIVSLMPTPIKILLVTRGNRFLEKALKSSPSVQLRTASQLTDSGEAFDICVLDDVTPVVWPRVNTLALHTASTNWFTTWETIKAPVIVDWKNSHPLLRFASFDNVQIAESLAVKPPNWGLSLVDSPQTPLIVAGEINRQRLVWVGFDPLQSTWPLRVCFPIFMVNAVDWLNPASVSGSQFLVQPGNAFRLVLPPSVGGAQVTTPDGKTRRLSIEPGARELVIGDTSRQGTYRLKVGTNEIMFCVNLLDSNESNIAPREVLPLGRYGKVAATTMKRANFELWRRFAAAGFLILLFEWWWYHRRTA